MNNKDLKFALAISIDNYTIKHAQQHHCLLWITLKFGGVQKRL